MSALSKVQDAALRLGKGRLCDHFFPVDGQFCHKKIVLTPPEDGATEWPWNCWHFCCPSCGSTSFDQTVQA